MERSIFHIVGGTSRSRAEQARVVFALGHHAEVYGSVEELLDHQPTSGVIFAEEEAHSEFAARLIHLMANHGIWIPVVITSNEAGIERAVASVKAGALDYLALPFEIGNLARRLQYILQEAGPYETRQRAKIGAAKRVACLSRRERQVLELLSAGLPNKDIAEKLGISPRTVEIHRSNMMGKLRANHPAEAVKAWLAADQNERFAMDQPIDVQKAKTSAPIEWTDESTPVRAFR